MIVSRLHLLNLIWPVASANGQTIAGVIHLCAGAVEGLSPDQVQVMDNNGLLTRGEDDPSAAAASTTLEAERAMEKHLMDKAQSLLDRALGAGRGLVQISVDLDFSRRTEAESTPTNPCGY